MFRSRSTSPCMDDDIGVLFGRAYEFVFKRNPAGDVNDFKATRISPFNPDYKEELFLHNTVLTDEVQEPQEPTLDLGPQEKEPQATPMHTQVV